MCQLGPSELSVTSAASLTLQVDMAQVQQLLPSSIPELAIPAQAHLAGVGAMSGRCVVPAGSGGASFPTAIGSMDAAAWLQQLVPPQKVSATAKSYQFQPVPANATFVPEAVPCYTAAGNLTHLLQELLQCLQHGPCRCMPTAAADQTELASNST